MFKVLNFFKLIFLFRGCGKVKHRHSLGERVGLCKLDIRGVRKIKNFSAASKDYLHRKKILL